MGTASTADGGENRRWFLLSLRASPFRVFNLCLRRQPLKWQGQGNVSKESFDSLTDLELGQHPATTSRTTERGTEPRSEKSEELQESNPTASAEDSNHLAEQATNSEDVELQSALQELSSETDLLHRLQKVTDHVLGELMVLTKIWESQILLRMGPASADSKLQQRKRFVARFRAAVSSWVLNEERHRGLQDLLKQPEASEFLNNATLAATEELLAVSAECLEQAAKRRELVQLLQATDPTEAALSRSSDLLEAGALKGYPVLEFKVRRSLGLPMTVQWTAELGKVALRRLPEREEVNSPRYARTIPSNISDVDI